ncbi:MAG: prepilin-type N-terminal cleavage/methylation domain-containing protein, partial [Acidimicrobiales bacterium]
MQKVKQKGFTLIEMLLVLAIMATLAGFGTPIYLSLLGRTDLNNTVDIFTNSVRRAQVLSQASSGDMSWGVYTENGFITLFKGGSYLTRDVAYDEVFALPTNIESSGMSEIVYVKFTGFPQSAGTTTFTSAEKSSKDIYINSKGLLITHNLVIGDTTPPSNPTDLAATGGITQVSLSWNANTESDLAGYTLFRRIGSSGSFSQIASGLTTSNYTDTGLSNSTQYFYRITATDTSNNESGNSNTANAITIDTIPPSNPTDLAATGGITQVSLSWNANTESDLAEYTLFRRIGSSGSFSQIASGLTTSNYTDTGLSNSTQYFYRITATDTSNNESGNSNTANAITIDTIPPDNPTSLAAVPGDAQVSLAWNANTESDLAGYRLYRGTINGGPYNAISGLLNTTSFNNTGLTNNTKYYYVV